MRGRSGSSGSAPLPLLTSIITAPPLMVRSLGLVPAAVPAGQRESTWVLSTETSKPALSQPRPGVADRRALDVRDRALLAERELAVVRRLELLLVLALHVVGHRLLHRRVDDVVRHPVAVLGPVRVDQIAGDHQRRACRRSARRSCRRRWCRSCRRSGGRPCRARRGAVAPAAIAQLGPVADRAAGRVERRAGHVGAWSPGCTAACRRRSCSPSCVGDLLDRRRRAVHAVRGQGGVRVRDVQRGGRRDAQGERAPLVCVLRLSASSGVLGLAGTARRTAWRRPPPSPRRPVPAAARSRC